MFHQPIGFQGIANMALTYLSKVYKANKNGKGEVEKYKARFVAKGYKKKHGIDYEEVEQLEGYVTKHQEGHSQSMIYELKNSMMREFEMTDIGPMSYYLGIEVKQIDKGIFICQETYAEEILKMFGMDKCNPVGTLLEQKEKPSKHDEEKKEPTKNHVKIAKRILYYIKGTTNYGMFYSTCEDFKLVGYSDSDWAGSKDDGRITSGFQFFLGNNAFTWSSKKQPIITLSSCEVEYVAATSCVCHAIWLKSMLNELHMVQEDAIEIYVDNKSAIDLAKNPVYNDRNIFTKPLNERDFLRQRMMLGVGKLSLKGVLDRKIDLVIKPEPI
uniref:Retrovirus-related Pol polyprotein from transposon TNT 1-94 n=1 Tax=Tanacetum cinerariifolium TaxID=118510 RepID=A0A6L2K7M9_TANCI|nr:retrovirus-related Pol polyprotein from transposon TNT 1-94 [Tanacetum cinerariifolium]